MNKLKNPYLASSILGATLILVGVVQLMPWSPWHLIGYGVFVLFCTGIIAITPENL